MCKSYSVLSVSVYILYSVYCAKVLLYAEQNTVLVQSSAHCSLHSALLTVYSMVQCSAVQKLSVRSLASCYQFVRHQPMGGYKMHHDHDCGGNHEEKDGVG